MTMAFKKRIRVFIFLEIQTEIFINEKKMTPKELGYG
jgi:hypothetical protein